MQCSSLNNGDYLLAGPEKHTLLLQAAFQAGEVCSRGPPCFPAQQGSSSHRKGNFAKSIYNSQKHSLKNAAFVSRKTLVNVNDLKSTLQWHIKDRACKKQLICNPRKSQEENVGQQL